MLSLTTVMALTGWSKRTLWRRISNGTVVREDSGDGDKVTKLSFEDLKAHICIPLNEEDFELVKKADAGSAEAQTDLALMFLANNKHKGAFIWLEMAANQNYSEAMHLIGMCHLQGTGVEKSENLGIMWIAKAAAHGHIIAQEQMNSLTARVSTYF